MLRIPKHLAIIMDGNGRWARERGLPSLWHVAYTEFYFSPVYWPDFTKEELIKALEDFSCRERKFGAVL
jgi:undecaprenyl pyrophosphate synthase